MRIATVVGVCVIGMLASIPARAQVLAAPGSTARLVIPVQDQSGGIIPTAEVTLVGMDAATRTSVIAPVLTDAKGVATFEDLKPGRYAVAAEFAGFDPNVLKDVRVRIG